jgi:hypothetical protein
MHGCCYARCDGEFAGYAKNKNTFSCEKAHNICSLL